MWMSGHSLIIKMYYPLITSFSICFVIPGSTLSSACSDTSIERL